MLALSSRCCGRARERIAIAAAGAVALPMVVGVQPLFGIAHHAAGLRQAHNTRLAIVTLLGIALLAGWGLDDLAAAARRGAGLAGALAPVRRRAGRAAARRPGSARR